MVLAKRHEYIYLIKPCLPTSRLLFREVIQSLDSLRDKRSIVNRFQALEEQR